ncbi:ATP-grasp fold amidoligase family protein [Enterobacter sp. CC120223-11]|uniref:ATP-grasp fold amidoligase family protein n=1 Tax=Enterobacter sp. CC120223-11 TaxID=1378073 RepID=UPI000BD89D6C|nr:ATP-grasp fold amidoligase family protein [Enterobacter sp. CC120223-11]SNY79817.1 TupA-like ATPgrasp [Enterobacter sp. CC120223-11]
MASRIRYLSKYVRAKFISDCRYVRERYRRYHGVYPEFNQPNKFTEKIAKRMISHEHRYLSPFVDKLMAREYVRSVVNESILVPLIAVYHKAEDINFDVLPEKFVLKCAHDSRSTIVCNKQEINTRAVVRWLSLRQKQDYYYINRERQYKGVFPTVLCEEYIDVYVDSQRECIPEMLRFHCFNGQCSYVEADFTDDDNNQTSNVYDRKWNLQPFTMGLLNNSNKDIKVPEVFLECLNVADIVAGNFDYCRVDLFCAIGKVYFSEITFTPECGRLKFMPREWDEVFGQLWKYG